MSSIRLAVRLVTRDGNSTSSNNSNNNNNDDDVCVGWCGSSDARWIVAGIIIAGVVCMCFAVWFYSIRRATGHWALTSYQGRQRAIENGEGDPIGDGGGLFLSSRRRGHRHRHGSDPESDPVPTYRAGPDENDAGYYDAEGNYVVFEPPPYEPPKAKLRMSVHEEEVSESFELDDVGTNSRG